MGTRPDKSITVGGSYQMKRIVTGILPVLLLVLALTFMTNYKSVEDLTDMEEYEIDNFVEAAEPDEPASSSQEQPDRNVANASVDSGNDVDPNKTYDFTSDGKTVTVYDNEGNAVLETSMTDWENNREAYYEKYRFGS